MGPSERLEYAFPILKRGNNSNTHNPAVDLQAAPLSPAQDESESIQPVLVDDGSPSATMVVAQQPPVITHARKPTQFDDLLASPDKFNVAVGWKPPQAQPQAYQVSHEDFAAFETWRASHPVLGIGLPPITDADSAQWLSISTKNLVEEERQQPAGMAPRRSSSSVGLGALSERARIADPSINNNDSGLSVRVPRTLTISDQVYVLLTLFPGSKTRQYFAGAFGVVVAYQSVATDKVVVLKTSVLAPEQEGNLEQEAFEILAFVEQSGRMEQVCAQQFVHLVAGTIAEMGSDGARRQSFVVLERMDATLEDLARDQPHLFVYPSAIRHILRGVAEGLACMHHTRPKPIAHGDLKPANLLCSPYTDAWLDLVQQDDDDVASSDHARMVFVKMSDFDGAYTSVWDLSREPELRGTAGVMSPQRLQKALVNKLVPGSLPDDIWAWGMCVLQLCSPDAADHIYSFFEQTLRKQASNARLQAYVETQLRLVAISWRASWTKTKRKPADIRNLLDLVRQCLSIDPTQRPTIDGVLAHPFLSLPPSNQMNDSIQNK